jgi:hypothetical protein
MSEQARSMINRGLVGGARSEGCGPTIIGVHVRNLDSAGGGRMAECHSHPPQTKHLALTLC